MRLCDFADIPLISAVPMFLPNTIQVAAVIVSGAWTQPDVAQCASGSDWVLNLYATLVFSSAIPHEGLSTFVSESCPAARPLMHF